MELSFALFLWSLKNTHNLNPLGVTVVFKRVVEVGISKIRPLEFKDNALTVASCISWDFNRENIAALYANCNVSVSPC